MSLTCNYQKVSRFSQQKRLRANDRYHAMPVCAIKCSFVSCWLETWWTLVQFTESDQLFLHIKVGKAAFDIELGKRVQLSGGLWVFFIIYKSRGHEGKFLNLQISVVRSQKEAARFIFLAAHFFFFSINAIKACICDISPPLKPHLYATFYPEFLFLPLDSCPVASLWIFLKCLKRSEQPKVNVQWLLIA